MDRVQGRDDGYTRAQVANLIAEEMDLEAVPEPEKRLVKDLGTAAFFKGNIRPLIEAHPELRGWREDFPREDRTGAPIPAVDRRQARCREFGWTLSSTARSGKDRRKP